MSNDYQNSLERESLCNDCFEENYTHCEHCDELVHRDEVCTAVMRVPDEENLIEETQVCPDCIDGLDLERCPICNRQWVPNYMYSVKINGASAKRVCWDCIKQESCMGHSLEPGDTRGFPSRPPYSWESTPRNTGPVRNYEDECRRSFKKIKEHKNCEDFHYDRYCGTEIEYYAQDLAKFDALMAINNNGVSWFKDGSLTTNPNHGKEIKTDPAKKSGLEKVLKLATDICKQTKGFVDKTCGFHIHFDAKEFIKNDVLLKRLFLTYWVAEKVIYKFLPRSRSNSRYCKKLNSEYDLSDYETMKNTEFDSVFYKTVDKRRKTSIKSQHGADQRYFGLNIHSVFFRGTIEFRYHSGTINYEKIKNWINLNYAIVDWVINHYDETKLWTLLSSGKRQNDMFFSTFLIPDKVTSFYRERLIKFKDPEAVEGE